jgi:hypothetical protein
VGWADRKYRHCCEGLLHEQAVKIFVISAFCAVSIVGFIGCATLDTKADAVEVRAEQTVSIAFDTFDTFLKLETQNRAILLKKAPEVVAFADTLRRPVMDNGKQIPWGISLVESANRTRLAYKSNRTADNKASLLSALAAVESALAETNKQLANASAK